MASNTKKINQNSLTTKANTKLKNAPQATKLKSTMIRKPTPMHGQSVKPVTKYAVQSKNKGKYILNYRTVIIIIINFQKIQGVLNRFLKCLIKRLCIVSNTCR
uniref:Uncharacterized protein n=1 Tax=Cacopsylla melanoneura TaxID=428564 RepID=A0A8D9EAQ5_9HEMI